MKRRDFLNYLSQQGCQFVREGSEHSIWENPILNRRTSVPRHREIPIFTVTRICKQLGISAPSGNYPITAIDYSSPFSKTTPSPISSS